MGKHSAPEEPPFHLVKLGKESNFWKYAGVFLAALLVLGGLYLWFSKNSEKEAASDTGSSFFASVGDAVDDTFRDSFDAEEEELVEVVNVRTGERSVGAFGAAEPSGVDAKGSEGAEESEPLNSEEKSAAEEARERTPPLSPPAPRGKININTASYEELQEITGVGPAIAGRIVEYRNEVGIFYSIQEIQNVNGIGPVTFEKMKNEITVGDVPPPPEEAPVEEEPVEDEPAPPPPPPEPGASGKININTAGYEELQEITGVGPVIAGRIIEYRNENGPFQAIEDIKNVSGIGDITFEKMKDEITVE